MPETIHYQNFDLLVSTGRADDYELRVLDSPAHESARPSPASAAIRGEVADGLAALRGLMLDREGLRALGIALMDWLFPAPIMELYRASLARLGPDEGLRVRLRIEPPELHELPWECCYDAETGGFIALDPRTPVVRYLAGPFDRQKLSGTALSVLVAIASPRGYPELQAGTEYARIEDALDALGGRVEVGRVTATIDALQDALRHGPRTLHFVGHGGFDPALGGVLVLEDPQGEADAVDAEVVAALLRGSSVRLAVLNACESARTDPTETFAGIAPRLVQAGLPAVVAMQTALPDDAALHFTRAFYAAVADGWPVDAAVTAGRQAIFAHAAGRPDWVVPVLYLSAPDGVLWEPELALTGQAAPPLPAPAGGPSFQFNFQGPVTIAAGAIGGERHATTVHGGGEADEPS